MSHPQIVGVAVCRLVCPPPKPIATFLTNIGVYNAIPPITEFAPPQTFSGEHFGAFGRSEAEIV
jgi:hypothetical protein